jgi:hypothetical protein
VRFNRVALCLFTACILTVWLASDLVVVAQESPQSSAASATATVPRLVRITGSVHDANGKPLTGNTGITFAFYKDQNDASSAWQEVQNVQLDSAGRYSVLLGATSETGLPQDIFSAGEARWLGVRPDGQPEQPRILFVSVAYALKAADADTLGGKPASAFVLAGSQSGSPPATSIQTGLIATPAVASAFGLTPATACPSLTSDGTATANQLSKFTTACNIENSAVFESGGNVGIGNTAPAGKLDVSGKAFVRGLLSALGGMIVGPAGAATASQGFTSSPFDLQASVFNTNESKAVNYTYRWQSEPSGNDSGNTGATLNLLYGVPGDILETGLSVARSGIITFATGQTFPALGTVTSVATGTGLTGGPITKTGTISIATGGVTNALLANPSITVKAGTGMSGGGTVALGGTVTLTNAAPSSGGTVTSVATGAGLIGGTITNAGTISIATGGVTNALLANPSITVKAGTGMSGGGTVALGGTVTLTNAAPSSGGTVTSVATGTGLTGGTITQTGTVSLNTAYTDARYLQLAGGTLTGGLNGTTATFTGAVKGTTGTFKGTMTSFGAVLPVKGTATATTAFSSNPFDLIASAFSTTKAAAVTQDFRWQAEPVASDTATPSGKLNLLFGSGGVAPAETGLSIASNGVITFASGQTFPGAGTITAVTAGSGLTGGGSQGAATLSLMKTCSTGQTLQWNGSDWACGNLSSASGTADGLAYFAGSSNLASTAAPVNGQLLIGSMGSAPVLRTLTAGPNISITNGPGSVTISAVEPAPLLPFFATGGERTGASLTTQKNVTTLWGFLLPYNVTTTEITYDVTTADKTANDYDIGIFNNSGQLVLAVGPTAGTTFAAATGFNTLAWTQGSTTLPAGRYYLALTTNCSSACAAIGATTSYVSFAVDVSAGATTGAALPSTLTPPADTWSTGDQPTVVIH